MTRAGGEDDRALVARLVAHRDERAFGTLYERHTPALYRLALRLTAGDAASSEDIVHDAWMLAVPRLREFAWRSRLTTWLSGFVVNGARERARRAGRETELADHEPEDARPLEGACDRLDLERALAALPHGYREVLVLHDVEGYTHDEIASALGIAPGTSKSQLARARAAVRRALGPQLREKGGKDHV